LSSSSELITNQTLCVSTYDSDRLLLIKGEEFLNQNIDRTVQLESVEHQRPMGLYWAESSLWVASKKQIWRFDNLLEPGYCHDGFDGLLTPSASFLTGEIDSHELVVTSDQEPVFVNTAFSCLATIRPGCSFAPLWKPPFISALRPEDRCHLNGVALQEGKPTWVTACSRGDHAAEWRSQQKDGGIVMHVPSGEIAAAGLSMPHSPRWHRNKLWLLNSGSGEFGWIDENSGVFESVCKLPGFARGLTFYDDKAIITVSRLRTTISDDLIISEQLKRTNQPDGACGIRLVDLTTGKIQSSLDLPETFEEIFDISLLPGIKRARIAGNESDDSARLIKLPDRIELIIARPRIQEAPKTSTTEYRLRYQRIFSLTPENLQPYAGLTFPSLSSGTNAQRRLKGELVGVCCLAGEQMIGLAIGERRSPEDAWLASLKVDQNWRRIGVGTGLVKNLEKCLREEGARHLIIDYILDKESGMALEPFLAKLNWSEPIDIYTLLEACAERLGKVPWADDYKILPPYRVEAWQSHHQAEAMGLNAPPSLLSATISRTLEPKLSLALLHSERLVGWVLVDRTTSTQVRYSSLFVDPAHRGRARGLALLASAFRLQGSFGPTVARAAVSPESESMIRLVDRHLKPYLISTSKARRSQIRL